MRALMLMAGVLLLAGCLGVQTNMGREPPAAPANGGDGMKISSTALAEAGMIPRRYTCDAENVSPPVEWSGVPAGAQTLALIVDDPDASAGTWIHWVVYDLPVGSAGLPEGIKGEATVPGGGVQGTNSFRQIGYGGPCPPNGTHRYYFRVYALDASLGLKPGATARELQAAMKGHVLAEAALMGKYQR
jgi:Raf kinase inhibitor-like YbhB/YbcL family protein